MVLDGQLILMVCLRDDIPKKAAVLLDFVQIPSQSGQLEQHFSSDIQNVWPWALPPSFGQNPKEQQLFSGTIP